MAENRLKKYLELNEKYKQLRNTPMEARLIDEMKSGYAAEDQLNRLPEKAENQELQMTLKKAVDQGINARNTLFAIHADILKNVNYFTQKMDFEDQQDAITEATQGFFQACKSFRKEGGANFHTHVGNRMIGAVKDFRRGLAATGMKGSLRRRSGKLLEKKKEGDLSTKEEGELEELSFAIKPISLSELRYDPTDQRQVELIDTLPISTNHPIDDLINQSSGRFLNALIDGVKSLSDQDRRLLRVMYLNPHDVSPSLKNVGNMLGFSESRASQIHVPAIELLRGYVKRNPVKVHELMLNVALHPEKYPMPNLDEFKMEQFIKLHTPRDGPQRIKMVTVKTEEIEGDRMPREKPARISEQELLLSARKLRLEKLIQASGKRIGSNKSPDAFEKRGSDILKFSRELRQVSNRLQNLTGAAKPAEIATSDAPQAPRGGGFNLDAIKLLAKNKLFQTTLPKRMALDKKMSTLKAAGFDEKQILHAWLQIQHSGGKFISTPGTAKAIYKGLFALSEQVYGKGGWQKALEAHGISGETERKSGRKPKPEGNAPKGRSVSDQTIQAKLNHLRENGFPEIAKVFAEKPSYAKLVGMPALIERVKLVKAMNAQDLIGATHLVAPTAKLRDEIIPKLQKRAQMKREE
jgi:DNA-directed RNA polymerase specialized sigma subunit